MGLCFQVMLRIICLAWAFAAVSLLIYDTQACTLIVLWLCFAPITHFCLHVNLQDPKEQYDMKTKE